MRLQEKIIHKLILNKGFSYYLEDKYLIKEILKFSENKNPKVLDVGCGIGHYSFLFEKFGADVVSFDYDKILIKKANEKKKKNCSSVRFIIADGNYPEKIFSQNEFDIIFMSGLSLFSTNLNKELMKKYLLLLNNEGKLIFIQNSNLTRVVRKTHIKNYSIDELRSFFLSLDCNIKNVYFYDRHIFLRFFRSVVFNKFSTKLHIFISKVSKLPCNIVIIVSNGTVK